jgi:UDP-N-acetylmuramoyl-L-alanyl-D-glutamate--2,6-diaminopimelate ligase
VKLSELAAVVDGAHVQGDASTAIFDVAYDSRAVGAGCLFFCVPGAHADGAAFAAVAVAAGAAALVVSQPLALDVPQLVVPSVRSSMGPIAAKFFGNPSRALTLAGITGTNGKTTSAFMLESVFRAAGMRAGLMGTVETHVGDAVEPVKRTTPEAIDLQRTLARMRDAGVRAVAMEVSSEGLHYERVEGTWFACSEFTNLTQDHLNTHGTMEAYFEAKALLFRPEMSARAVVNADDPYGRALADRTDLPLATFGIDHDADVKATEILIDAAGSRVQARLGSDEFEMRVPLPARHNVSNALGVVAIAHSLGIALPDAIAGIEALRGVPGRLERVDGGRDFTVLVDYAHTPDSLDNVLRAARDLVPEGARLVVVFGCGGDRDRAKRPLMGRVAAALADRAIVTSDNPRSEDPLAIVEEVAEGARETGRAFEIEPDRRAAISRAIGDARAGDVIVIAGKGHESGQEFADRTIPFDDRVVAREILREIAPDTQGPR